MKKDKRVEWTNEYVLEFLELFQGEPCIWDPSTQEHRNRNKVQDAWQRLQVALSFECAIYDLKKKKDSLMASYRTLVSKKKKCLKSGVATDEHVKPNWFAFETMDKFLAPVYHRPDTINTERNSTEVCDENRSATGEDTSDDENGERTNCDDLNPPYRTRTPFLTKKHINAIRKKKVKKCTPGGTKHAEERMERAFEILKEVAGIKENDDCDLYGQLLAKKLRKFNDDERESLMLEIDTMLLRKKRHLSVSTLSPASTFISLCSFSSGALSSVTSAQAEGVAQYILKEEEDNVQQSQAPNLGVK